MVLQHTVCGLYLLFENLILIETSVYIGVGANQNPRSFTAALKVTEWGLYARPVYFKAMIFACYSETRSVSCEK